MPAGQREEFSERSSGNWKGRQIRTFFYTHNVERKKSTEKQFIETLIAKHNFGSLLNHTCSNRKMLSKKWIHFSVFLILYPYCYMVS